MPLYEFHCSNCNIQFELEQTVSDHARGVPECPKCGSKEGVQKQLSSFYAKTASKR